MQEEKIVRTELRKELKELDLSPHYEWNRFDAAVAEELELTETTNPDRLIEIFIKYNSQLSHFGYWFMLGVIWNRKTEFLAEYADKWVKLFGHNRPKRNSCLMRPSEAQALRLLPKKLNVYWPPEIGNEIRISFSTTRPQGSTMVGRVDRDFIVALFTRKGIYEAIILNTNEIKNAMIVGTDIKLYTNRSEVEKDFGSKGTL